MFTMEPELKGYLEHNTLGLYLRCTETAEIEGLVVDVKNILDRRFFCDGTRCLQPSEGGEVKGDCCRGPIVLLTDLEKERLAAHLEGIMPHMAPKARAWLEASLRAFGLRPSRPKARARSAEPSGLRAEALKAEGLRPSGRSLTAKPQGKALARSKGDRSQAFCQPYAWRGKDPGVAALRLRKGYCLFRVLERHDGGWCVRCAIHKYCLTQGLALWEVKPFCCWFWPLSLLPLYNGRFLLTVHTMDTYTFTGESRGYVKKVCLSSPPPEAPFIYQAFAAELRHLFGEAFYEKLAALAAERERGNEGSPRIIWKECVSEGDALPVSKRGDPSFGAVRLPRR